MINTKIMDITSLVLFWFAGTCFGVGIGITIGKYIERKAWNKLIDEGKIPRPNKKI